MATVVGTWRSAPRPPGATMLVGPDGTAVGSVSGGCVESAVYELAQQVVETGRPVLRRYGVSDSDAFAVGLTCGGILDVFGERADPLAFPEADEVIVAWPHRYLAAEAEAGRLDERTVVCVLTHDPKFDAPLLELALRLPLAYVGAMGSRRTHDDRLARLREAGLTEVELARLRSPIGLDLGARTPEETAVAIAAELIQLRWGGTGKPLTVTSGRIHHHQPA